MIKWAIKKKAEDIPSPAKPFVRPAIEYEHASGGGSSRSSSGKVKKSGSSKRATLRSQRKHVESADRQLLHGLFARVYEKPGNDWRTTLEFMRRHTPRADRMYGIRAVISGDAAVNARRLLLDGFDTGLAQIERRHQSVVRLEEEFPLLDDDDYDAFGGREGDYDDDGNKPLALSISGSEVGVRDTLREIIEASGKITALRVDDDEWREKLREIWKGDDKVPPEGGRRTITVHNDSVSRPPPPRYTGISRQRYYKLTKRADEIPPPTEWTKLSFREYISALVHGRVPTILARQFYAGGPSHQEVVVSLLVRAFEGDEARVAASVSALKLALMYIHYRGPVFRPAARAIFTRAEQLGLPVDGETYGLFLASASRAGDINNFNSILRVMVRRRFPVQSHAWHSFLEMLHDPRAKRHTIACMRHARLHNVPPFAVVIGRQLAPLDLGNALLQSPKPAGTKGSAASAAAAAAATDAEPNPEEPKPNSDPDMARFIKAQDAAYGWEWLDTTSLNKLLDLLGSHGRREATAELVRLAVGGGRTQPDATTLNTLLTHAAGFIVPQIATLRRFPARGPPAPDAATYRLLFRTAWRRRLPNALRVIWLYALLQGNGNGDGDGDGSAPYLDALHPKIEHDLATLLSDADPRNRGNQRALLKTFEDVVLGREELAQARRELQLQLQEQKREHEEEQPQLQHRQQDSSSSPSPSPVRGEDGRWKGAPKRVDLDRATMRRVAELHLRAARGRRLARPLADLLADAHAVDLQVHDLLARGTVFTPARMAEMTVDILFEGSGVDVHGEERG